MSTKISFASFNLYNFQYKGKKTYPRKPVITEHDYCQQRHWIQEKLREIDSDVVVFQELWSKECLDEILQLEEFKDYEAHYINDDGWYQIAVALIVRRPWEVDGPVSVIKDFPFQQLVKVDAKDGEDDELVVKIRRFSRSVIKACIKHQDANTPPITLFGCHLKSKLASSAENVDKPYQNAVGSAISTIRRTAEATALRMMLIDHMKGANTPTVVIGDLNDGPLSNTLNIITNQPKMTKNARGGDKALYSTLFLQQLQSFRDVFYTHEHKNHLGVLDHILVSEEFFEHSTDAIWAHEETRIWNDHVGDQNPYSSDHGIIKSTFK
ncbi:endonuclease/exonuclease/phosphatase family protein [Marinibactrum halimedae]|nr:endonuclease/exonuclease/phosphatase family protein [Marinibactrum halimedae]MCD9460029.1 endonuclease/exonuclease/phosphatase family protein [Marinibactrum halimedae]